MKKNMDYYKVIKELDHCPFCTIPKDESVDEGKYFYVIPARAPYSEGHILIIPKKHIVFMQELSREELDEMYSLIEKRTKRLNETYESLNLLLRNGHVGSKSGKSIDHFHFHIIPNCIIDKVNNEKRNFLSKAKYHKLVEKIKLFFKKHKKVNITDHK